MAFEKEQPVTPTSIGELKIVLLDLIAVELPGGPQDARQEVRFQIQVLNGDGIVIRSVAGDLAPHLTQPQIDQLKAFMTTMRAKAEDEILP